VRRRLGDELRRVALALGGIPGGEQRVDVGVLEPEQDTVVAPDVGVPAVVAVPGGGLAAMARGRLGKSSARMSLQ
jgi:hypothetical protein